MRIPLDTKPSESRFCRDGLFSEYIQYTDAQESPEDFHLWSILTVAGAVLGRNVGLNRGYFNLYPNLFTVLVADSAIMRKSSCISIAERVLRDSLGEYAIFSQKITTESFINFLAKHTEKNDTSTGFIAASEFSVFFGKSVKDPTLLQTLTDLYDCPDLWSYSTISRGIEQLKNVFLTMLAGSTLEWMKSSLPEEALGGGFLARLIPVHREDGNRSISNPEDFITEARTLRRQNCIADLKSMSRLKGEFKWNQEAKCMFRDWYEDFGQPDEIPMYLGGYFGRKGTTLLKIAMICSASRSNKLILEKEDIMFALTVLNENEEHIKKMVEVLGQTEAGKEVGRVLHLLRKAPGRTLTHSNLLRRVSNRLTGRELREIVETLESSGQISVSKTPSMRGEVYTYISGRDGK